MPAHWTYDDHAEADDLCQGDILLPTEELRHLLRDVHPHFCNEKYLGFVVLTQTCDLVQRAGASSARYINLAVVRSLSEVLPTLLDTVCRGLAPNVYPDKDRSRARDLLGRIFNQNEQKLGIFYLYPADIGIGEDAVAFLRVGVAFRVDHYNLIRRARQGRLLPEFATKLGWLVGNLYSRVGTRDWPEDDLNRRIDLHLSSNTDLLWLKESVLKHIRQKKIDLTGLDRRALIELANRSVERPKDLGIERTMENVRRVVPNLDGAVLQRLELSLRNDPALTATFR